MVTQTSGATVTPGKVKNDWVGLSTDAKPTNAANGSTFIEMDTGKAYMYDQANAQWREL